MKMTHKNNANQNSIARYKKRGTVKHLLSTAALCLALQGSALATEAATPVAQSVPVETTLQTAYDQLIADSKAQMMRDPVNALEHAASAENLARTSSIFNNRDFAVATAMWLRGEALMRSGKPNEAASVIQNALDIVGDNGLATKLGGDLLLAHGRSASRASDVETAVRSFFKAHEVFVGLNEPRSEAMALMAIGSIYRDAQAYLRALEYYQRASDVFAGDANLNLASFNNQANTLKELEQYTEAREFYTQAYAIAEEMDSDVLKARILTNVAELEVLDSNYAEAEAKSAKALAFLEGDDNTEWKRFVFGTQAHANLKQGNVDVAAALIKDAFDGLDIAETSMSFEEMHDTAYQVHLMRGEYDLALQHHQSFKRLADNAKKAASSANLALMGAKFHSSEQELNIQRLKNEQLAKDIALESANRQMTLQVAVMAAGGLVLLFLMAGIAALRNHRNRIAIINDELSTTNEQLNDEIDRREIVERDLVSAKDQAEEANRMKSTFLATMSHELRTPMNGILGFSKILQDTNLDEEQRTHIDIIEQSGQSLLGLINDILDLSQLEAGKLGLTDSAFNIRSTVEDAVRVLQPTVREKDLNLAVQIDPDLPVMVTGDADRIRQIVVNLAGNAVKFTETGSVTVVVSEGVNSEVNIAVTDTGIGIADDKVGILFDRFAQADDSTTRKFGGSGLGLAICKELVDAMGGEIGVETELGEGSKFWVNVPLAPAEVEEMAVLPRAKRTLAEPKRVVIVDDIAANAQVFDLMLPAMNVEPHQATSGVKAIELFADLKADGAPVDAVVVNANLGGIAANDLIKRLDRNGLIDGVKRILCTSKTLSAGALMELGFDTQIDTPITEDSVFAALRDAIGVAENNKNNMTDAPSAEVLPFGRSTVAGRVLVVEDNAANQEFITAILSEYEAVDVDLVRNGVEAVDAAAENAYDMILMDVHMPTMNGIEATRRIRRIDGLNAKTPIIALTAKVLPGDRDTFLEAGMDDVLSKPLELKSLRSKVKTTLERKRPVFVEEQDEASVVSFDR